MTCSFKCSLRKTNANAGKIVYGTMIKNLTYLHEGKCMFVFFLDLPESQLRKLLKKHEKDVAALSEAQEEEKLQQQEKFKVQ